MARALVGQVSSRGNACVGFVVRSARHLRGDRGSLRSTLRIFMCGRCRSEPKAERVNRSQAPRAHLEERGANLGSASGRSRVRSLRVHPSTQSEDYNQRDRVRLGEHRIVPVSVERDRTLDCLGGSRVSSGRTLDTERVHMKRFS